MREDKLKLDKLLSKAQVLEASKNQAEGMEQACVSTDTLRHLRKKQLKPREQSQLPKVRKCVISVGLFGLTQQAHVQQKENMQKVWKADK